MDCLVNTGKLNKGGSLGTEPPKMLHKGNELHVICVIDSKNLKTCTPAAAMAVDEQPSDRGTCLEFRPPITPDSDRESISGTRGALECCARTPLSMVSSSCLPISSNGSDKVDSSCEAGSPHTPREGVFDAFAPGPDDMALAPERRFDCKKLVTADSQNIVGRRLSFEDNCEDDELWGKRVREELSDAEEMSEDMIVESVYEVLLEMIILKQTEAFLDENCRKNLCDHPETDLQTTPSSKLTSKVVADGDDGCTCPGAPMKPVVRKSMNIDTVRRRLEF